jgi:hypothetical protein
LDYGFWLGQWRVKGESKAQLTFLFFLILAQGLFRPFIVSALVDPLTAWMTGFAPLFFPVFLFRLPARGGLGSSTVWIKLGLGSSGINDDV